MADINVELLEKEMAIALEADRHYQRENDAKFRTINQKVASYEEFRDIVKASHIKALDRQDLRGGNQRQLWNTAVTSLSSNQSNEGVGLLNEHGQPESPQEFPRVWCSYDKMSHDQYRLLMIIPKDKLSLILTYETSGTIFGDILQVLSQYLEPSDCSQVCEILTILGKYPRLSLSIDMLSKVEKTSVETLFQSLIDSSFLPPHTPTSAHEIIQSSTVCELIIVNFLTQHHYYHLY